MRRREMMPPDKPTAVESSAATEHGAAQLAAAEHSARLRERVMAEIEAAGGWIGFERFMELALYTPGLGYYSGGAEKLGAGGDFTTAPEVSRLFGACVAVQCAEVLRSTRAGSVLEIGAGSGRLAGDLLARLETLNQLPEHYWILEVSADLRQRQRKHLAQQLPQLLHRVQWLDRPPEEPFDGVILANEVLDALPVARFRWQSDAVEELGVEIHGAARGREFAWGARPARAAMREVCRELLRSAGPGMMGMYPSIVRGSARGPARSRRRCAGGRCCGSTTGCRVRSTICRSGMTAPWCAISAIVSSDDPFATPGLQDISAWVDFTRVAEASREAGFELAGFTTQAHFLAGLKYRSGDAARSRRR